MHPLSVIASRHNERNSTILCVKSKLQLLGCQYIFLSFTEEVNLQLIDNILNRKQQASRYSITDLATYLDHSQYYLHLGKYLLCR